MAPGAGEVWRIPSGGASRRRSQGNRPLATLRVEIHNDRTPVVRIALRDECRIPAASDKEGNG